jgi:uncharacterized protein
MQNSPSPASGERIAALDITRGIAVLGILLLNIVGFGLPYAYEDPTNAGGAEGLNLAAWRINALLFEGTMRGLFTILFGASALLFLERARRRSAEDSPTKIYFRRMLWLCVFGLINGYLLLWDGDILFYYGVVGCLLFLFRNWNTRRLLIAAAVTLILQFSVTTYEYVSYQNLRAEASDAQDAETQGLPLTLEQREALGAFEEQQQDFKPAESQLQAAIDAMRTSYWSAFEYIRGRTFYVQTTFFIQHGLGDSLAMMLLGMALLRSRLITAEASPRIYQLMALMGYGIGLTVNAHEVSLLEAANFSVDALIAAYLSYDLGRIPMTLGHLGLIMLMCRSRAFARLKAALAATGKMALTNYLSQSVICLFLFTGAGLSLYGQLQRHQLYYIVVVLWILQIWWSTLWLKDFQHGPTEWVWRRLTYYGKSDEVIR